MQVTCESTRTDGWVDSMEFFQKQKTRDDADEDEKNGSLEDWI